MISITKQTDRLEVSMKFKPDELRIIGNFLLKEADEIEKWGKDFGHTHLQYAWKEWTNDFPDFVVYDPYYIPDPDLYG